MNELIEGNLQSIREFELMRAKECFPVLAAGRGRLLELGAGNGYQARMLEAAGFDVTAVDMADSYYHSRRVFPIIDYDGKHIPQDTASVDIVFSSNLLEHVGDIDDFLDEIARVMTKTGYAIHVLPTPAWRFWTSFFHYFWLVKRVRDLVLVRSRGSVAEDHAPRAPRSFADLLKILFPFRHGERGNVFSETFYFSRRWWLRKFSEHGYDVVLDYPVGIFYSGAIVLGGGLSIRARQRLARFLGSSSRLYVLKRSV
ncbi:class I SAM-dependent methyltransferase [Niveibacterium terrae]|uniref:class I SAM-dependent methyltransferase n=1 Tax=Niveibacterium terrae TaxID=3373598 RepID=UPI003A8D3F05